MATTVLEKLVYKLGIDVGEFNSKIGEIEGKLKRMGKSMGKSGKKMTARVSLPVVGVGGAILKMAGDFESAMNGVKAVSGATQAEFEALREKAKKLGITTTFSATESAEGIEMLARNGLKAKTILDGAADASLMLAAATGTGLSNAANITTDAMSQFGIESSNMSEAVDKITGVTTNSKFGIDDYRLALAQAGGTAGKIGVSFDDFNATIATLAPSFSSGADAGTSFKTFISRLVPASTKAAQTMEDLGIRFFDSQGKMKGMADIAGELQKGLKGLSDKAKINVVQTLFGTDAQRAALAFAEAGKEGIESMKGMIDQADATQQAKDRMDGFNGAMKRFRSVLEGLAIVIADSGLLEWAGQFLTRLTELVSQFSKTNPALFKWGTIIAGIGAALGPILIGLGGLITFVGPLVGGLITGFGKLAGFANPIVGVFAALAAGYALGTYLNNKFGDSISKVLFPIFDKLVAWIKKITGWLKKLLGWLSKVLSKLGSKLFGSLAGVGVDAARKALSGNRAAATININQAVSRSDVSNILLEADRQAARG